MRHSLYFCRTPLQSLIVQELIGRDLHRPTVLYHAISDSPRHRYYFEKIDASEKHFVNHWQLSHSDTASDLLAWYRIPRALRLQQYNSLYVASIGSIPFSFFARRNAQAALYTFDDGAFNLAPEIFRDWIECEPQMRRRVKALFGGSDNTTLVQRSATHFSIFPASLAVMSGSRIEEVQLFTAGARLNRNSPRRVRIILGTVYPDPAVQQRHDQIVASDRFDLFLPHPIDPRRPKIGRGLAHLNTSDVAKMIAEDVVRGLVGDGYSPVVYGFDSTALLNLSGTVQTVSIQLQPGLETLDATLLGKFGTRLVKWYERSGVGSLAAASGVKMWTNPSTRSAHARDSVSRESSV